MQTYKLKISTIMHLRNCLSLIEVWIKMIDKLKTMFNIYHCNIEKIYMNQLGLRKCILSKIILLYIKQANYMIYNWDISSVFSDTKGH